MTVIGLTGSFGTGKSTVAGMFRELGAGVLDADSIAHKLIRPGKEAWKKIVRWLGRDILDKGQGINRAKLSKIVLENSRI